MGLSQPQGMLGVAIEWKPRHRTFRDASYPPAPLKAKLIDQLLDRGF